MSHTYKIGKVTVADQLKIESAIRRELEIQSGMRINHHRVQRSKKTYTRKLKHNFIYNDK